MQTTPKGLRLHIGIYGRRNAGKSSLLNRLVGQKAAIVSATPGTTTDPVEKTIEFLPVGPVVFIDTAGIDDSGCLGELRKERTLQVIDRTDVGILVTESHTWGPYEEEIVGLLQARQIPFFVVLNKADLMAPQAEVIARLKAAGIDFKAASALLGDGIDAVRDRIVQATPDAWFTPPHLIGDLLPAGELALLVVPIDLGAPKGRIILPQIMAIRDILDSDAYCMMVKERELKDALLRLNRKPGLVVCDSQVVLKTIADTPRDILLTTFSILMARFKGDLATLVHGITAIDQLKSGDKVLIVEACSHHPLADDIGRVKIPRWLRQYAGGKIHTDVVAGPEFACDLSGYKLIIHCGGCMINRKNMLARIFYARRSKVPITNYGLAIAYVQGVLPRVLEPFPAAKTVLEQGDRWLDFKDAM
jgi:[FeFe] hydrogenase H-cluster maturation GTPase HydF